MQGRGTWKPARVRWLEGSRARQTPLELFIDGNWRQVELTGEELRQSPEPHSPRLRRFRLRIAGDIYLLEGPCEQEKWRYRAL